MGPCFQFFDFCVSYTNLRFYAQGVAMKKWFFHHFFCVINITNTMTNIEIRDFVSIFSGKGLISIPIMESCAEFTQLTLRFHLLSAAQIHDRRARCLIELKKFQPHQLYVSKGLGPDIENDASLPDQSSQSYFQQIPLISNLTFYSGMSTKKGKKQFFFPKINCFFLLGKILLSQKKERRPKISV